MKLPNLKIVAWRLIIFVVAAAASLAFNDGQTTIQPKPKKVKVYFMVYEPTGKLKFGLNPVVREVDSSAPLRPAIEALLAGPTVDEEKQGYAGVAYGRNMKLAAVKIKGGAARIDFTREDRENTNPGDLLTLYFADAVVRTATQFPSVKKVTVCVNGWDEFGLGMTKDAPVPCPKEK